MMGLPTILSNIEKCTTTVALTTSTCTLFTNTPACPYCVGPSFC